jgi:hypothetical protein
MKIETKAEPNAKIKLVSGSAFAIETAPHLPSLHQCILATGRRGIGKSVAITSLLTMYKETGTLDRLLVISPSFNSNIKLMSKLDVKPEDVFDNPDEPGLISKIIDIVDGERDDFLRWKQLKINYERIMKQIKAGFLPASDEYDDYLMRFYDMSSNSFRMPEPKYECYKQGRPPVLVLYLDDCMCSKAFTDRKLASMVIKHRHLGQLPTGGAVGLTLAFTIQSYKATAGLPKCIRNQATSICVFRTKDESELKQIQEGFGGEVDEDTFYQLYREATGGSLHDFLFIDIGKLKPTQPSMFRRNFDEYLIISKENVAKKEV